MKGPKGKSEKNFNSVAGIKNLSCQINYVWINDKPYQPAAGDPPCGVPLRYIDQVVSNAERYPDAQFSIWLDPEFLKDSPTLDILQSHIERSGQGNLNIRNLNDLDEYRNSPFYSVEGAVPVWQRVDMARMIITKHSLENYPDRISVYSDFDVKDVGIGSKKFQESIGRYGFVIGATKGPQQEFNLENGYFAFNASFAGKAFLNNLLQGAYEATGQGLRDSRNDIFYSYRDTVKAHCKENRISPVSRCLINVLEPCTYQVPRNPQYEGLSI